ncbi:cytochrome P450 [Stereum hirsutum FP-91666 SS1]|uniref:cytochrome P450 n=1 Tax=Stereum hirsutum (strain FP-91666) TaxID=721885 RepID=UPI000444A4F8|nr:cytochrome P450 [Stereum hirsutum FP-91666 SS1]EIM84951.1 cytochrome P450 [Stereum hirsutum FP-91666 SS1]
MSVLLKAVRHWSRQAHLRAFPGPPRTSLIAGNLNQLFDLDAWEFQKEIASHGRIDTQLHISDPKALHHILIKEQDVYDESDMFVMSNNLFFGPGLLSTRGEHHRRQRKLLNPVFSTKHMKSMVPIFYTITHQLCDVLTRKVSDGTQRLDILDWMTRLALEAVGQGGLGYSFESLNEESSNNFGNAMKGFIPTVASLQLLRQLVPWFHDVGPPSVRRWIAKNIPIKRLNRAVRLTDVMDEMSREILDSKKAALKEGDDAIMHQVGEGKDILSILMKANMEVAEEDRLPESEIIAQMSTLIFAAMDTTSSAMARIIHMLAENQEAQEKLREELIKARQVAEGDLDYDSLLELPYLDAVCRETLRLHPPFLQMFRTTQQDAILPIGPVNTKKETAVFIPKNTTVIVGIKALNCDQAIWGSTANEWIPERWLSPLPETVTSAGIPGVYSNMLTFLAGSRACIGFKFSELEMKIALCLLVSTFRFSPSETKYSFKSTNIVTPMVNGKSCMPLNVSLARATSQPFSSS